MIVLYSTYFLCREQDIYRAFDHYLNRLGSAADYDFARTVMHSEMPQFCDEADIREYLLQQSGFDSRSYRDFVLYRIDAIVDVACSHPNSYFNSAYHDILSAELLMDPPESIRSFFPSYVIASPLTVLKSDA